jgi:hypothetical protein
VRAVIAESFERIHRSNLVGMGVLPLQFLLWLLIASRSRLWRIYEEKRLIVDLSHVIEHGMTTYKGLPGPHICDFWEREATAANYDDGSTFQIGRIDMVANTGTYLDAPFHRYRRRRRPRRVWRFPRSPICPASSCAGQGERRSDRLGGAFEGARRSRQGGAGPHRLGPPLAHRRAISRRKPSLSDRRGRRLVARRARRGAGRDRQQQYR